jgi:hypothetical protein
MIFEQLNDALQDLSDRIRWGGDARRSGANLDGSGATALHTAVLWPYLAQDAERLYFASQDRIQSSTSSTAFCSSWRTPTSSSDEYVYWTEYGSEISDLRFRRMPKPSK